jgi:protein SCO1/2
MKKSNLLAAVMAVFLLAALLPGRTVSAQGPSAKSGPDMRLDPAKAEEYFPDVELVDQDGETVRFYSDLIEGKSVVINVFFTSCVGVCPVLSQKVAAIQEKLGDRLGKEVHLISISVDPETDTVQRLKVYAARFKARPGWYFLGGKKENIDWALQKLGQYVKDKEGHSNILLVGNSRTGRWKKIFGLAPPAELVEAVLEVLNDDPA